MISKQQMIATITIAFVLLIVGLLCLLAPDKLRDYALRPGEDGTARRLNPFAAWMRTRQYLWSLRALGGISVGSAVLIFSTIIRNLRSR